MKNKEEVAYPNILTIKTIGINTYRENIIYLRADSEVCESEGFTALTRIEVFFGKKSIIATLNVVEKAGILNRDQAALSSEAMTRLGVTDGDQVRISHLIPVKSLSKMRAKMHGKELNATAYQEIIQDIVKGRYSNIELAAFITSCTGQNLTLDEIIHLTGAMVSTGMKINWKKEKIFDKHSIGGLPGNRTTPLVVSIVAASGFTIPKTSSRAITSPAGTADTMEVMTNVNLSLEKIQEVVRATGGCFSWGGAVNLSPADDILISVEKALEVDSEGQMIASVISKKVSAGSTHVLIEIPVGKTAKVRSQEDALKLKDLFKKVAESFGIIMEVILTNGEQPIGRGIGPALEAMDVLQVLRNEKEAPLDLKEKAISLSGALLELSGEYTEKTAIEKARSLLESGEALRKFYEICYAQGRFTEPSQASFRIDIVSAEDGEVIEINNRELARVAKLAGAPIAKSAGIILHSILKKQIQKGDLLITICSEAEGELNYALEYFTSIPEIIKLKEK